MFRGRRSTELHWPSNGSTARPRHDGGGVHLRCSRFRCDTEPFTDPNRNTASDANANADGVGVINSHADLVTHAERAAAVGDANGHGVGAVRHAHPNADSDAHLDDHTNRLASINGHANADGHGDPDADTAAASLLPVWARAVRSGDDDGMSAGLYAGAQRRLPGADPVRHHDTVADGYVHTDDDINGFVTINGHTNPDSHADLVTHAERAAAVGDANAHGVGAVGHTHPDTDSNADPADHTNQLASINGHGDANADTDGDSHVQPDGHADTNGVANINRHTDSDGHADTDPDPNRTSLLSMWARAV